MKTCTRQEYVNVCRQYLGVPFRDQGRNDYGLDCVGVPIRAAQETGISDFDITGYKAVPGRHRMERLLAEVCERIPVAEARLADLYHLAYEGHPHHLAVISCLDPMRVIHADTDRGRVVEHGVDGFLRVRIRGAYRIPGLVP